MLSALSFVSCSFVASRFNFSSKSTTKSSKNMFPVTFQLSGNKSGFFGPKRRFVLSLFILLAYFMVFGCYGRPQFSVYKAIERDHKKIL